MRRLNLVWLVFGLFACNILGEGGPFSSVVCFDNMHSLNSSEIMSIDVTAMRSVCADVP